MESSRLHISFLCSRLDVPGGLERAITNTANLLQENGYRVSVVILDAFAGTFFPLNSGIDVYQEPLHFGITPRGNFLSRKMDFLSHTSRLKKKLREIGPQVLIATEYPFAVAATLSAKEIQCKVFAWEHHHFQHLDKSRFWRSLQKQFYPKADSVVCLNGDEAKLFAAFGCKTAVIPNFVERGRPANLQAKTLLTVGWLSHTKGIDLLPAIAEEIVKKHPDWHWKIIGTGEYEKTLRSELEKRDLLNHVHIISPQSPDLEEEYLSSSLYVMLSRFECFPMVLLEAMSHGIPCVAFDCPTGPRHIISNGNDGVLVMPAGIATMINAVSELISDEEKRRTMGANAYQNVSRYSTANIFPLWEELFR